MFFTAKFIGRSGSSLVPALIFSAVMGVFFMAAVQTYGTFQKEVKYAKERSELVIVFDKIRMSIENLDSCKEFITNEVVSLKDASFELSSLKSGEIIFKKGVATNSIMLNKISLEKSASLPQTQVGPVKYNHYRTKLLIEGKFNSLREYAFAKEFYFDLIADASDNVVSCYKGQDNEKTACEVVGGIYNLDGSCTVTTLGVTSFSCPAGQSVYGFDSANKALCAPIPF